MENILWNTWQYLGSAERKNKARKALKMLKKGKF